jgi:predicted transcriptional regulator of viral defense system
MVQVSTKKITHDGNNMRPESIQHRIYLTALRNRIITLAEAKAIAGRDASARMAVWRLSQRGELLRIREGLYAAVPPEQVGSEFEVDRYVLIDRFAGKTGALAYHSALELHGIAYSRFNKVFYITKKRMKPFSFQDIDYHVVLSTYTFGTTTLSHDGMKVPVTDKERTFLDCIRRPDLCGGFEEYIKSLDGFTLLSPVRLLDYLERFDERCLYQRAGLILTILKGRIRVQDDLLDVMRSRVGPTRCYLLPGMEQGGGVHVKEWNVIVPENIQEMIRFV